MRVSRLSILSLIAPVFDIVMTLFFIFIVGMNPNSEANLILRWALVNEEFFYVLNYSVYYICTVVLMVFLYERMIRSKMEYLSLQKYIFTDRPMLNKFGTLAQIAISMAFIIYMLIGSFAGGMSWVVGWFMYGI